MSSFTISNLGNSDFFSQINLEDNDEVSESDKQTQTEEQDIDQKNPEQQNSSDQNTQSLQSGDLFNIRRPLMPDPSSLPNLRNFKVKRNSERHSELRVCFSETVTQKVITPNPSPSSVRKADQSQSKENLNESDKVIDVSLTKSEEAKENNPQNPIKKLKLRTRSAYGLDKMRRNSIQNFVDYNIVGFGFKLKRDSKFGESFDSICINSLKDLRKNKKWQIILPNALDQTAWNSVIQAVIIWVNIQGEQLAKEHDKLESKLIPDKTKEIWNEIQMNGILLGPITKNLKSMQNELWQKHALKQQRTEFSTKLYEGITDLIRAYDPEMVEPQRDSMGVETAPLAQNNSEKVIVARGRKLQVFIDTLNKLDQDVQKVLIELIGEDIIRVLRDWNHPNTPLIMIDAVKKTTVEELKFSQVTRQRHEIFPKDPINIPNANEFIDMYLAYRECTFEINSKQKTELKKFTSRTKNFVTTTLLEMIYKTREFSKIGEADGFHKASELLSGENVEGGKVFQACALADILFESSLMEIFPRLCFKLKHEFSKNPHFKINVIDSENIEVILTKEVETSCERNVSIVKTVINLEVKLWLDAKKTSWNWVGILTIPARPIFADKVSLANRMLFQNALTDYVDADARKVYNFPLASKSDFKSIFKNVIEQLQKRITEIKPVDQGVIEKCLKKCCEIEVISVLRHDSVGNQSEQISHIQKSVLEKIKTDKALFEPLITNLKALENFVVKELLVLGHKTGRLELFLKELKALSDCKSLSSFIDNFNQIKREEEKHLILRALEGDIKGNISLFDVLKDWQKPSAKLKSIISEMLQNHSAFNQIIFSLNFKLGDVLIVQAATQQAIEEDGVKNSCRKIVEKELKGNADVNITEEIIDELVENVWLAISGKELLNIVSPFVSTLLENLNKTDIQGMKNSRSKARLEKLLKYINKLSETDNLSRFIYNYELFQGKLKRKEQERELFSRILGKDESTSNQVLETLKKWSKKDVAIPKLREIIHQMVKEHKTLTFENVKEVLKKEYDIPVATVSNLTHISISEPSRSLLQYKDILPNKIIIGNESNIEELGKEEFGILEIEQGTTIERRCKLFKHLISKMYEMRQEKNVSKERIAEEVDMLLYLPSFNWRNITEWLLVIATKGVILSSSNSLKVVDEMLKKVLTLPADATRQQVNEKMENARAFNLHNYAQSQILDEFDFSKISWSKIEEMLKLWNRQRSFLSKDSIPWDKIIPLLEFKDWEKMQKLLQVNIPESVQLTMTSSDFKTKDIDFKNRFIQAFNPLANLKASLTEFSIDWLEVEKLLQCRPCPIENVKKLLAHPLPISMNKVQSVLSAITLEELKANLSNPHYVERRLTSELSPCSEIMILWTNSAWFFCDEDFRKAQFPQLSEEPFITKADKQSNIVMEVHFKNDGTTEVITNRGYRTLSRLPRWTNSKTPDESKKGIELGLRLIYVIKDDVIQSAKYRIQSLKLKKKNLKYQNDQFGFYHALIQGNIKSDDSQQSNSNSDGKLIKRRSSFRKTKSTT